MHALVQNYEEDINNNKKKHYMFSPAFSLILQESDPEYMENIDPSFIAF